MTMHINLSKDLEAYIEDKVAAGSHDDAADVIRDAVRRMQQEEARVAAFQAAVEEGIAELDRGEGIRWTETTMDEIVADVLAELDKSE